MTNTASLLSAVLVTLSSLAGGAVALASTRLVPNTLSGRVLDASGKPVADAEVWIQPASFDGLIKARTDAQGYYRSVELNPALAPYQAQAYKIVNFHGEKTCVRMGGETRADFDAFNAKAGAERNFRWRMQGDADGGYDDLTWGADLRFYVDAVTPYASAVREDERLEVLLVPNGPLIDGSVGKPLRFEGPMGRGVRDIPVGRYDLTIFVVDEDGRKTPLKIKADNTVQKTGWSTKLTVLFDGLSNCGHYATYHTTLLALSR